MKKWILCVLLTAMVILMLSGCGKPETDVGVLPPMLIMNGEKYFARDMPVKELSGDFVCMGELTAEEANNTNLQGCKYYANKYISSFDEFYVYQECGTPIDENTVDSTQRQWAYVRWIREGFEHK